MEQLMFSGTLLDETRILNWCLFLLLCIDLTGLVFLLQSVEDEEVQTQLIDFVW